MINYWYFTHTAINIDPEITYIAYIQSLLFLNPTSLLPVEKFCIYNTHL